MASYFYTRPLCNFLKYPRWVFLRFLINSQGISTSQLSTLYGKFYIHVAISLFTQSITSNITAVNGMFSKKWHEIALFPLSRYPIAMQGRRWAKSLIPAPLFKQFVIINRYFCIRKPPFFANFPGCFHTRPHFFFKASEAYSCSYQ